MRNRVPAPGRRSLVRASTCRWAAAVRHRVLVCHPDHYVDGGRPRQSEFPRRKPCSTTFTDGADDGIRTRDPHLGKVMLYQLSHVRVVTVEATSLARGSK